MVVKFNAILVAVHLDAARVHRHRLYCGRSVLAGHLWCGWLRWFPEEVNFHRRPVFRRSGSRRHCCRVGFGDSRSFGGHLDLGRAAAAGQGQDGEQEECGRCFQKVGQVITKSLSLGNGEAEIVRSPRIGLRADCQDDDGSFLMGIEICS